MGLDAWIHCKLLHMRGKSGKTSQGGQKRRSEEWEKEKRSYEGRAEIAQKQKRQ